MSDGVIITVEIVVKPEQVEQTCESIPPMFNDTVTFPGFRSIRVVRNKEEPNRLLILEHWDKEEQYHAYQAWRAEEGQGSRDHLLSFRYAVWPTLVGAAQV